MNPKSSNKHRKLVNEHVLVLNKFFLAIQVTIAKEAICALVTGKAQVIDQEYAVHDLEAWKQYTSQHENDLVVSENYSGIVHSPTVQIFVPQVIRVPDCEFNNPVIKTVKYSRRNVYQRDNHMCQYCGRKCTKEKLTLDHVIPRSRGGKSSWTNVVTCCKPCNEDKGNKLLEELGWKLKKQPTRPKWKSHIGIPFDKTRKAYWDTFLG